MKNLHRVSLGTDGQTQLLSIPPELALRSTEVILWREGDRLMIEPLPSGSLLDLLTTLPDIDEDFADMDEGLLPVDDITL